MNMSRLLDEITEMSEREHSLGIYIGSTAA